MRPASSLAILLLVASACREARRPERAADAPPAACKAAFELAVRDGEERAEEPATFLLEGHGACAEVEDEVAGRMQADGHDVWPWSPAFGEARPRCPSPKCGPPGAATRVTVDVVALPATCQAIGDARDDDEGARGAIDLRARHARRLETPCDNEGDACERARVRLLRHGGGSSMTVFLLCEGGRYVAYEDLGGMVVY